MYNCIRVKEPTLNEIQLISWVLNMNGISIIDTQFNSELNLIILRLDRLVSQLELTRMNNTVEFIEREFTPCNSF